MQRLNDIGLAMQSNPVFVPWYARCLACGGCLLAAMLLTGCEDLPPLAFSEASSSDQSTAESGRGGYDWRVSKDGFEMVRPTNFTYFGELDRAAMAAGLTRGPWGSHSLPAKPTNLDERQARWLESRTHGSFTYRPRLCVPASQAKQAEVRSVGFSLSPQGNHLLTLGTKIQVRHSETGEVNYSIACPPNIMHIRFAEDESSIWAVTGEGLRKISLKDAAVIHRWDPGSPIIGLDSTLDGSVLAVVLEGEQLVVVNNELKVIANYTGPQLSSSRISLHPRGKWLLGNTESGLIRWHLNESQQIDVLPQTVLKSRAVKLLAGDEYDYWFTAHGMLVHNGSRFFPSESKPNEFRHPIRKYARCSNDYRSWPLVLSTRPNGKGGTELIVQDIFNNVTSQAMVVPNGVTEFACNALGNLIALGFEDQICIVNRYPGTVTDNDVLQRELQYFASFGQFDQVESIFEYIRQIPLHQFGRTGEELYADCVIGFANYWLKVEAEQDEDLKEQWKQWLADGSLLATCVLAKYHQLRAGNARGEGFASTVSPQGWAEHEAQHRACIDVVTPLFEHGIPPAIAYRMLIFSKYHLTGNLQAHQSWLRRFVEAYPNEARLHGDVCNYLLPKWSGEKGDAGAYVAALADCYPPEFRDRIYTRVAMRCLSWTHFLEFPEMSLSIPRIFSGTKQLMEDVEIQYLDAISLLELAVAEGDRELTEQLSDYIWRHFNYVYYPDQYFSDIGTPLRAAESRFNEAVKIDALK